MTLLRCLAACVLLALGLASAPAVERHARSPYAGVIVTDAATGKVLYEENADVSNPPASMAKLMTFAVLHDKLAAGALKLDTPVRVMPEDAKMGGTQVFLDPRETFPVEELIYAMMIQSANDAAHALARAAAGSVPAFVELMNAKARELGMTHTTFRTPHGLPPPSRRIADGDLTTPRDFAVLCRHLVLHTDVLKYTSIKEREFGTGVRAQPMRMDNHNKLLGRVAGVDGLKTGYTVGAGYCLSATAERNGRRVIAVIMGSFGPHGEIDKGRTRDLKAIEFLERGFAALPATVTVAAPAAAKGPLPDPVKAGAIATVKTDRSAAPAPDQASTATDQPLTFRVIPPAPKP
ncbi:MAG TPA: D-alanyl-D-alanine carboxypeptidase family protein [Lacunisphaera sp.]|nr:D-alanyl-D-alanine carboxypeptidase family protein [Lacunisphaera sp.]